MSISEILEWLVAICLMIAASGLVVFLLYVGYRVIKISQGISRELERIARNVEEK